MFLIVISTFFSFSLVKDLSNQKLRLDMWYDVSFWQTEVLFILVTEMEVTHIYIILSLTGTSLIGVTKALKKPLWITDIFLVIF